MKVKYFINGSQNKVFQHLNNRKKKRNNYDKRSKNMWEKTTVNSKLQVQWTTDISHRK